MTRFVSITILGFSFLLYRDLRVFSSCKGCFKTYFSAILKFMAYYTGSRPGVSIGVPPEAVAAEIGSSRYLLCPG